jgi:hypothetical protein
VPLDQVHQGGKRPHIKGMPHLDLSDEEAVALIRELADITGNDRYLFSPRIRTLREILAKFSPEPVREPPLPLKQYEPPSRGRYPKRLG